MTTFAWTRHSQTSLSVYALSGDLYSECAVRSMSIMLQSSMHLMVVACVYVFRLIITVRLHFGNFPFFYIFAMFRSWVVHS